MSKFEVSQNPSIYSKDNQSKVKVKDLRQGIVEDIWSGGMKQNDIKHMNAIKPYVNNTSNNKQRKNSKQREIKAVSSHSEINRSRSKRIQSTSRKSIQPHQSSSIIITSQQIASYCPSSSIIPSTKQKSQCSNNNEITQIYQQLMTLKSKYKQLKISNNNLVKQKQLATNRQQNNKLTFQKQTLLLRQQIDKYKKSTSYLQGQIQRIKRQCFKIIQSEKFKYKKLQQTLQQKQLMIAYLRKQIEMKKMEKMMILGSNNGGNNNSNNLSMIVSNSGYNTCGNNNNNHSNRNNNNEQMPLQLNTSSILSSHHHQQQQDNLQRVFFMQNSMPIFSYQSYARMNGNNLSGNVLVEDSEKGQGTPTRMGKDSQKNNIKRSEYEEDSLSFSRDKSKQFDSVHSLLTINNHHNDDQTILTFTKKDIIVLDESFSSHNRHQNPKNNSQQLSFNDNDEQNQSQCPTIFEIKKHQGQRSKQKEMISFESIKAKRILSRSERAESKRQGKNSKLHTKRLEIMTDHYPDEKHKEKIQDQHSCDTKKKHSKNKIKNNKKASKSEALHNSIMSEVLHGSFIKKDSTSLHQSKSHHHTKRK